MIYLTGDLHGNTEIRRLASEFWPEGKNLTKEDYLVILGDFGLLWDDSKSDRFWLNWLNDKPWTTLWIDGNHENFDLIAELPQVPMFDSVVGKVRDSIYHLKRGEVYSIDGHSIFTLGGALSIDKVYRKEGVSWWPGEMLSTDDLLNAWDNLMDNGMEVDYVFTHTCPSYILPSYGIPHDKLCDPVSFHLQDILDVLQFKHWYFGHLHHNRSCSYGMGDVKFTCIYDRIIKLGEVL